MEIHLYGFLVLFVIVDMYKKLCIEMYCIILDLRHRKARDNSKYALGSTAFPLSPPRQEVLMILVDFSGILVAV